MRFSIIILLFILIPIKSSTQDVEETYNTLKERLKNDPVKMAGTLSAFGMYYNSDGPNRSLGLNGRLSAGLNLDILGIRAPLSMMLNSGGKLFNYTLPSYAFVGLSPSYKWAKVHIGNRSLQFDPYSFNGQSFEGLGTELTPGNWIIKAFYGRLRRSRIEDANTIQRIEPIYRRLGAGIQAGYKTEKDQLLVALFRGWDQANSIPEPDSTLQFFPSQNMIISFDAQKALGPKLKIKANYAISGLTENINAAVNINTNVLRSFGGLLETNVSSRWNHALNTELEYRFSKHAVNLSYEKVDPGYKTLGALFFNDDFKNYTAGGRFRFLNNKLNLYLKSGLQQNNIKGDQKNNYNRFIASANVNYQITDAANINLDYSNFNKTNIKYSLIDPINPIPISELVISNQSANANFSATLFSNAKITQLFQCNANYTTGKSIVDDVIDFNSNNDSYSAFIYTGIDIKTIGLNFGLSYNYNSNILTDLSSKFQTYSIILNKAIKKDKLLLSLNGSIGKNSVISDAFALQEATLSNYSLNINYKISQKTSLIFSSNYLRNNTNDSAILIPYSELRTSINFRTTLGKTK